MTETDYNTYQLSPLQKIFYTCIYIAVVYVYASLFYDSLLPILFSLIIRKKFLSMVTQLIIKRQKEELLLEFKEWLFSINSSLTSGYALENAIVESLSELDTIYGKKSLMYKEVLLMCGKLKLNIPLEDVLNNFALRSGLKDIDTFSQVISLVKKNGGNMINVIKNASESIGEEISLKAQIDTEVSSSRYELYIMAVFPLIIIKYIDFTQPGFFTPLYHNTFGVSIMTICLVIYIASLLLAGKILNFTRR